MDFFDKLSQKASETFCIISSFLFHKATIIADFWNKKSALQALFFVLTQDLVFLSPLSLQGVVSGKGKGRIMPSLLRLPRSRDSPLPQVLPGQGCCPGMHSGSDERW